MIEVIGWSSSILFILCGIPQAYQSYKSGNSNGISPAFLWMWFAGEVCGLIYIFSINPLPIPIFANYVFSILVISVIIKYRYFPRSQE